MLISIGAAGLERNRNDQDEPSLEELLVQHKLAVRAIYALVISGVLYAGYTVNKRKKHAGNALQTQPPD